MVERVNVRVDMAAIQSLFTSYTEIAGFASRVRERSVANARAIVGKRTGSLAASITSIGAAGSLKYTINVSSRRDYAGWVEEGTNGPIRPTSGRWLAVGKREGKKPVYREWVQGQRGQNYLRNGAKMALAEAGIAINFISF